MCVYSVGYKLRDKSTAGSGPKPHPFWENNSAHMVYTENGEITFTDQRRQNFISQLTKGTHHCTTFKKQKKP